MGWGQGASAGRRREGGGGGSNGGRPMPRGPGEVLLARGPARRRGQQRAGRPARTAARALLCRTSAAQADARAGWISGQNMCCRGAEPAGAAGGATRQMGPCVRGTEIWERHRGRARKDGPARGMGLWRTETVSGWSPEAAIAARDPRGGMPTAACPCAPVPRSRQTRISGCRPVTPHQRESGTVQRCGRPLRL
jgi:hypothetical protein